MFKNKIPYIEFKLSHESYDLGTIPDPVPSNKAVPNWYKRLKPDAPRSKLEIGTAKRCIPFLDAVTQGYTIPLWADLVVQAGYPTALLNENKQVISNLWGDADLNDVVGKKLSQIGDLPPDVTDDVIFHASKSTERVVRFAIMGDEVGTHGAEQIAGSPTLSLPFGKFLYKLTNPWSIKTPKGWSVQVKNPANSFETNLVFFEGVVDTDEYNIPVNFPFMWNGGDGEFVIPKGTPLLQVIPFQRQTVNLRVTEGSPEDPEITKQGRAMMTVLKDRYRRLFWHNRKKQDN